MTIRLSANDVHAEVVRVLLTRGVSAGDAETFAGIVIENSLDGVTSHGVTRLPAYVGDIDNGYLAPGARPERIAFFGAIEQWDGKRSLGPIACTEFMNRAMQLARENGIGCVAARNSTHWLRAGTYPLLAAREGFAAIAWSNARPGMPAWGGSQRRLGNNPIAMAVPGNPPILVDIAMSQFSFGKIQEAALAGRTLPVAGAIGFDGKPTTDAAEIVETLRAGAYRLIPTGYWKGSALAFTLDALAAVLSSGLASREVETETPADIGVSQVFLAFDLQKWTSRDAVAARIDELIDHLKHGHDGVPEDVHAPGESRAATRDRNEQLGIPVDEKIWDAIRAL